uniref:Gelsolin n=1 Tax=Cacopsylla melanoneura TaxID=428564 RepID=A0A8D8U9H9_9HEMI
MITSIVGVTVALFGASLAASIAPTPITKNSVVHPAFVNSGRVPGLKIWRIEKFEPVPVPEKSYGKFYSGDSYIILNTKEEKGNKKKPFSWDIHYWLGKDTSQDESGAAAILSVDLDDSLGGAPVQHREVEEHESQIFLSYFKPGVRYMPGGVASGFNHVDINAPGEKKLYQIKGKKNIRVRQVALTVGSMNKGDCFALDTGTEVLVYVGSKAARTERLKAISVANQIRDQDHNGRATVGIIDENSTPVEINRFFTELGSAGSNNQVADVPYGGDDAEFETKQDKAVKLFKVSDASGTIKSEQIEQIPLAQKSLTAGDAYILDTVTSGIYVWIGKESSTAEKVESLKRGQSFLTNNNYPAWTKLSRVVQGAEPTAFKQYFSEWRDQDFLGGLGGGKGGSTSRPAVKTEEKKFRSG